MAIDIDPANNPMVESKRPKIATNMPQALIDIFARYGFVR
ncbi:MAG: M15 family metallopeptidase [Epsilonproteobacteria bacterium]|nr:M15 family metallopeptidase [Campylobacterota bacterium]